MFIKCRKCGLYKDKSEYFENKKNIDGVCGMCIECMKIYKPEFIPIGKIFEYKIIIKEKPKQETILKKIEPTYRCYKCGEYKIISEFYKDRSKRNGIKDLCKNCAREYNKTRPNRQRIDPLYAKNYHLQYKFGIGIEEHNRIYAEQNGCCNICKKPFETMDMDHDHVTGKIRGLLCRGCNIALGLFHDNIESLEKALIYLK